MKYRFVNNLVKESRVYLPMNPTQIPGGQAQSGTPQIYTNSLKNTGGINFSPISCL